MMKRIAVLILLVMTLCCTVTPAFAADKWIKNEDYWLLISMKNDIIVKPCTIEVGYNVKNFNKSFPSWDYLENVVLHFPERDLYIGHVPGKKTVVDRVEMNITEEMIQAGEFTVGYTLDYYNSITDEKINTQTGSVTLRFRTAPDSFSKMFQDFMEDLGKIFWYGVLLVLVFIAVASIGSGGGFLIIFHK